MKSVIRAFGAAAFLCSASVLGAQARPAQAPLRLDEAQRRARQSAPELRAAQALVDAALAIERHAGVLPNPTVAFDREQASGGGLSASQNVIGVTQLVDIGGQRGARRSVAALRRQVAEAQRDAAVAVLDLTVARAYAGAASAERRFVLADSAVSAFTRAETVTERRFAAGDVSGYAVRRIRLEVARYIALRADAALVRRTAMRELHSLTGAMDSAARDAMHPPLNLDDSSGVAAFAIGAGTSTADSLVRAALTRRAEFRVAALEAEAAAAEAVRVRREGTPSPSITAGFLTQRQGASADASLNGFTVGVAVPVPLWDRREGLNAAAAADIRRRQAEGDAVRRRVAREVADAVDAYRMAREQVAALAPRLGAESATALRSAEVAYEEGEITLAEWLDAVRAYHEAEAALVALRADVLVRRAMLARAVGADPTLSPGVTPGTTR